MTIQDFADIIGKNLISTRYAGQNGRCVAQFEHCNVQTGIFLRGVYGTGKSLDKALENYSKQISGNLIVFNAAGGKRQEFNVPELECSE